MKWKHTFHCSSMQDDHMKIDNFWEVLAQRMHSKPFKCQFKMRSTTLAALTSYFDVDIRTGSGGVAKTPAEKMVAMAVSFLGCQTAYQQMSVLFGVSEDTFIRCTEKVVPALIAKVKEIIQFPRKENFASVAEEFDKIGKRRFFPNTIGALDGMHLRVNVKKSERNPYYNYQRWHSIHLQGISNANKTFLDVFVGWPGRAHDAMVWKNSPIKEDLPKLLHIPGHTSVNTYHIVADSAYPCTNEVMTAFKSIGARLADEKKKFNQHLSSKRNGIERAFKLLVQRFP